jgi:hypothetical protein
MPLTGDPDLHLLIDGNRLEATTLTDDVYVFNLPRTPASTRVVSRAAAPRELGLAPDSRSLGVALSRASDFALHQPIGMTRLNS